MDATLADGLVRPAFAQRPTKSVGGVVGLRHEVERLRREVAELRQQVGYWKSMHARAVRRNEELQEELDKLQGENRQLKDKLFGRKSEKETSNDRSNSLDDPEASCQGPRRRRGHQPEKPGHGRRDYSHLPVIEEFVELSAEERICGKCGKPRVEMTETEDSEVIEVDVRPHRRRIRRKRYRATCDCPDVPQTLTAPAVPKLIPKGRYGISIWVLVLLDKFASYRATGNLVNELNLYGLDLSEGTLSDGLKRIAVLLEPIYEALLERNGQSVSSQADETRWPVFVELEGKNGHGWWLGVFVGEDTVAFRIAPTRGHQVPEGHDPEEAQGFLTVDRYSAYKAMAQVKQGRLKLSFCWSHVRRDFVGVGKGWPELVDWALAWLQRIRELYRLNRARLKHAPGSAEFEKHDAALREAVEAMHQQAIDELAEAKLREPCRKALQSLLGHWSGLVQSVDDPRIPMDNNGSERQLRGPSPGRKNYYGSGSQWSVKLAAAMFSILATLDCWDLNPRLWLTWYLEACAAAGGRPPPDIHSFLPWNLSDQRRRELANLVSPPHPVDSS